MSTWDWLFGIVGVVGTIFSFYTYFSTEKAKVVEEAKNNVQQEKLRSLHMSLVASFNSADGIVQTSKKENASLEQLGDMARILRGLLFLMAKDTETEASRLRSWRFGKMISSQDPELDHFKEVNRVPDDADLRK